MDPGGEAHAPIQLMIDAPLKFPMTLPKRSFPGMRVSAPCGRIWRQLDRFCRPKLAPADPDAPTTPIGHPRSYHKKMDGITSHNCSHKCTARHLQSIVYPPSPSSRRHTMSLPGQIKAANLLLQYAYAPYIAQLSEEVETQIDQLTNHKPSHEFLPQRP